MSSSTVRGLLKGLRYISQIFETEKVKEKEIVIGLPTDVKHVAHIGNDGPSSSSNTPSWMNTFQGHSETSSAASSNNAKRRSTKSSNRDLKNQGSRDVQKISEAPLKSPKRSKSKESRHHKSGSPGREVTVVENPKQPCIGSPGIKKHSNLGSPRRSRSKLGTESPSRDTNAAPSKSKESRPHKLGSPDREVMVVENPKQSCTESPGKKKHSNLESPRRSRSKLGTESPSQDTNAAPSKSKESRPHKSGSPGREVMVVEKARHHKQPGSESPARKKHSNLESPQQASSSSKVGTESPSRDTNAAPSKSKESRHHKSGSPGREVTVVEKPRHHKQPGSESPGRKKHANIESPRRPSSSSKLGAELPSRDSNAAPKTTRRKKRSTGEGAMPSKSRITELKNTVHPHSDPGPGRDTDNDSDDICQMSVFDKYKDEGY